MGKFLISFIITCFILGQTGAVDMGKRVHLHEVFEVEERQWVKKIVDYTSMDTEEFEAQCRVRYEELGNICPEGWNPHGEHLNVAVGGSTQSKLFLNCEKVVRCKTSY